MRKLSPVMKIEVGGFMNKERFEEAIQTLLSLNAQIFSPHYSVTTREIVDKAHKHGLEVHVWTVDDKSMIEEMKRLNVDGITTNYPDLV